MARTVLVTDDSVTTYLQLKRILEQPSSEFQVVDHATSGEDAVQKFEKHRPTIVLMDIVMPGMGGVQAIKNILAIDKDAKVVVVSSLGGVRDKVVDALAAGAKNVIVKPFEAEKVLDVLRKV